MESMLILAKLLLAILAGLYDHGFCGAPSVSTTDYVGSYGWVDGRGALIVGIDRCPLEDSCTRPRLESDGYWYWYPYND